MCCCFLSMCLPCATVSASYMERDVVWMVHIKQQRTGVLVLNNVDLHSSVYSTSRCTSCAGLSSLEQCAVLCLEQLPPKWPRVVISPLLAAQWQLNPCPEKHAQHGCTLSRPRATSAIMHSLAHRGNVHPSAHRSMSSVLSLAPAHLACTVGVQAKAHQQAHIDGLQQQVQPEGHPPAQAREREQGNAHSCRATHMGRRSPKVMCE